MIINDTVEQIMKSPVRTIEALVEVHDTSTDALVYSFPSDNNLIDFTIDRVSEEGLFFGFGICQHLKVKVIDKYGDYDINPNQYMTITYRCKTNTLDSGEFNVHPKFYITQVRKDSVTNQITIYGYDAIYESSNINTKDGGLVDKITDLKILTYLNLIGKNLKVASCHLVDIPLNDKCLTLDTQPNIEGTESLRDMLNDIAEATQAIYYVDAQNRLILRRLNQTNPPSYTVSLDQYFDNKFNGNRRLQTIANVTELGENVSVSTPTTGTTQYVKNNCFWDLRTEDINIILEEALKNIGNLTIGQFDLDWRGLMLIEFGDRIEIEDKNGDNITTFFLNDTIEYNGTYQQTTKWKFNDDSTESATNSNNLGDILKQTYAKVDKANKKVDIMVSDVQEHGKQLSQLTLDTEQINAKVERNQEATKLGFLGTEKEIQKLSQSVETKMDAESVDIAINKKIGEGVGAVTTSTGFTFDDTGLTVRKRGKEMKTEITEDGMTVYKRNDAVLIANNEGVEAKNLHATTYLIIGNNSRFEDYGNRTGCFWIGN